MSKKRKLTAVEEERVNTVKANARRLRMPVDVVADEIGYTDSHVFGIFTGRYLPERTDEVLGEMERFLAEQLGVRYVQPYFYDLPSEDDK